MQPPHTRDLLSHDDGNHDSCKAPSMLYEEVEDTDPQSEDPIDIAEEVEGTENRSAQTPPPQLRQSQSTTSGAAKIVKNVTRNAQQQPSLPLGVIEHVISSSDTSDCNVGRRVGNTAVCQKSLSGHSLIAEATRASGDIMAGQMREMAKASRDLEQSKIEVQLKLFSEQMEYKHEKDRRLHKSSCIANENAKLAIEKQGEVVKCLAQLSSVLSMGLQLSSRRAAGVESQTTPATIQELEKVPKPGSTATDPTKWNPYLLFTCTEEEEWQFVRLTASHHFYLCSFIYHHGRIDTYNDIMYQFHVMNMTEFS